MHDERDGLTIRTECSILWSVFFCAVVLFLPAGLVAKGKQSSWIEVRSPHFSVVSNASKAKAKMVALRLELIRTAMDSIFQDQPSFQPTPLTILAPADEPSFQALLPEFFKKRGEARPAGVFMTTLAGPYIILRADYVQEEEQYSIVFHEYTHYAMRRGLPGLPPWLTEGLAGFYANTRVQGHDVLLGVADPNELELLYNWPLIPVQALLKEGDAPHTPHDQTDVQIFYAESWALTHYLLMQDAKNRTHRVRDYAQQVAQGGDPVKTFAKIFGSTKHMDSILTPYVGRATYPALKYPIAERLSSKNYEVRPLSVAEADSDQAEFLLLQSQPKEAVKFLKTALAANPRSAEAHALMGYLLDQEGDRRQAAAQAQKAIQLDPHDYRGYYYAALAMRSGQMSPSRAAEVEQDLQHAITLNPSLPGAQNLLGKVYFSQGKRLDLALAWAARAVQEQPDNTEFLTDMEAILLKQDRQADAVRIELRMLARAHAPKQQAQVRNELGWSLLQQNVALTRADFEIKKAVELDPKNADIIDSLGHLLEKEGDLPGAEAAYRRALALQPKMVSSLEGLGDVLRKQHQLDQAIAEYHQALAVEPKNAKIHYRLSLALQEKGDDAGAASELKAARDLDPYNTKYQ